MKKNYRWIYILWFVLIYFLWDRWAYITMSCWWWYIDLWICPTYHYIWWVYSYLAISIFLISLILIYYFTNIDKHKKGFIIILLAMFWYLASYILSHDMRIYYDFSYQNHLDSSWKVEDIDKYILYMQKYCLEDDIDKYRIDHSYEPTTMCTKRKNTAL